MRKITKNKKGVSVMIGYIFLITISVIISTIVYQQLKTYVPSESRECTDGVSVFLKQDIYKCSENFLNITFKNTGRFGIAGYFIKASDSPDSDIATIDISDYVEGEKAGGMVIIDTAGQNSFNPGDERTDGFNLSKSGIDKFYSIEVIPIRYEEIENKNRLLVCGNARITETLGCYVPPIEPVCGNGIIESGEGCDDNKTANGDGCSSTCQIESGWDCSGEPSVCTEQSQETEISYSGFESGDQGWIDGGSDSDRVNDRSKVTDTGSSGGTWSYKIRDNTGASVTYQNFNFQGYTGGRIEFWGYYESFENNECLELKVDGNLIDSWGNDPDLSTCQNDISQDTWIHHSIPIPSSVTFDSSVEVRFEGEMSSNNDKAYMDGIKIVGIS